MYAAAAIPPETSSPAKRAEPAAGKQKPKLLDRLREALRSRQYSRRTEQSYCQWAKRFISFHTDESIIQRVVKAAAIKTGIARHATCHTIRHSFATHLLEDGYLSAVPSTAQAGDIRTVQELPRHTDVSTTMVYTYFLNRGGRGVRSPADHSNGADSFVSYADPYKTLR